MIERLLVTGGDIARVEQAAAPAAKRSLSKPALSLNKFMRNHGAQRVFGPNTSAWAITISAARPAIGGIPVLEGK